MKICRENPDLKKKVDKNMENFCVKAYIGLWAR